MCPCACVPVCLCACVPVCPRACQLPPARKRGGEEVGRIGFGLTITQTSTSPTVDNYGLRWSEDSCKIDPVSKTTTKEETQMDTEIVTNRASVYAEQFSYEGHPMGGRTFAAGVEFELDRSESPTLVVWHRASGYQVIYRSEAELDRYWQHKLPD